MHPIPNITDQGPQWKGYFRKAALLLLLSLCFTSLRAQYQNVIKGTSDDEFVASVKIGTNYVTVGNTTSFSSNGRSQILLSKFDGTGKLLWSRVISDPADEDYDYIATDIQASCADSTYNPINPPGKPDPTIYGWQPMTCSPSENSDFYISGYKRERTASAKKSMILIKTDFTGVVLWTRAGFTPSSSQYDEMGISVEVINNWDVFIVGSAHTRGSIYDNHVSLARLDRWGNVRWFYRYRVNGQFSYVPHQSFPIEEIIPGSPIGIAITGEYMDSVSAKSPSAFVMRINYYGREYWRRGLPTRANLNTQGDGGYDLCLDSMTSNNTLLVTGYSLDNNNISHTYLFQMNAFGTYLGGRLLKLIDPATTNYVNSYGQSIVLGTPKAKAMIAGGYWDDNTSHTFMLKTAYNGAIDWARYYPQTTPNKPATESISIHSAGTGIATNSVTSGQDAHIILPDNTGMVNDNCQAETLDYDTVSIGTSMMLTMAKSADVVRQSPLLAEEDIEPDTTRCFINEQPPLPGCCAKLLGYIIDSCKYDMTTGNIMYKIRFLIDTSKCLYIPGATTNMIYDPNSGQWVSVNTPIWYNIPSSMIGTVGTFCIQYRSTSPFPPYVCHDFLCVNILITNCGPISPSSPNITSFGNKVSGNELTIYPNPVFSGNTVTLNYQVDDKTTLNIRITDLAGKEISAMNASCIKGAGKISMPINDLHPGIYLVNCQTGKEIRVIRLVVQ